MRRASGRTLATLLASAVVFFVISVTALAAGGARLSVKLKPPKPSAGGSYTLIIKGKALTGHLGTKHNRSEVDQVEQFKGSCSSTPQAELTKSGTQDLGPVFVKKGKFKIREARTAATAGTKVIFCIYLSSKLHKLDATASTKYHT